MSQPQQYPPAVSHYGKAGQELYDALVLLLAEQLHLSRQQAERDVLDAWNILIRVYLPQPISS